MTRRWILILYIVPAILLALGSLPFLLSDLDMELSRKFYNEKARFWTLSEKSPWSQLSRLGAIPAIVTAIFALSVVILGLGRPALARRRKTSAFLFLSLIIGPGLIASLLLGEFWGRPQPHETLGLGGNSKFERLLNPDPATGGHSFVSGPASTGFYFFSAGLALLASGRRKTSIAVILFSVVYGSATGIASLVRGAHFASDVLWSAGVVWFTAAGLFHLLGLHRADSTQPVHKEEKRMPAWVSFGILMVVLAVIGTTSLAFPHTRLTTNPLVSAKTERLPDTVQLTLDLEGPLEIAGGDNLHLETESRGIGFPGARLLNKLHFIEDGSEVIHRRRGFFTKLNIRNRITLPPNRVYRITLGKKVSSVVVLPPSTEGNSGHFAHVWLTSGFGTKLRNIKSRATGEDFFGRRTRSFRVE